MFTNKGLTMCSDNELLNIDGGGLGGAIAGFIYGGAVGMSATTVGSSLDGEIAPQDVWKGYITGALTGAAIGTALPF